MSKHRTWDQAERDAQRDPRKSRPPDQPAVPPMWTDGPWHRDISAAPVDVTVTNELGRLGRFHPSGGYSPNVRFNNGYRGGGGGNPFQEIRSYAETTIWSRVFSRNYKLRLPPIVRRNVDGSGANQDSESMFIDSARAQYHEISAFGPELRWPLSLLSKSGWHGSDLRTWSLDADWRAERGMTAAKMPRLPFIATDQEFYDGVIDHAQMLACAYGGAYDSAGRQIPKLEDREFVGMARDTDGRIFGHPLLAGMRLRLRHDKYLELCLQHAQRPHIVTFLTALHVHGLVVSDWTDPKQGPMIRMASSRNIDLSGLLLAITDFEVLLELPDPFAN